MPKLTLEDKRRETLRRQLYGKEESFSFTKKPQKSAETKTITRELAFTNSGSTPAETTTYLYKDLTKVISFSVLALGFQLSLYFLMQNNILKLPF